MASTKDAGLVSSTTNVAEWFEIAASDLARAKAFYEDVLGISLAPREEGPFKMAWFPIHKGAQGSAGALVEAPGRVPSRTGSLVYLTVSDIDAALAKVVKHGGKVVLPKTSGPEFGSIAQIEDSEGNLVALYSH